MLLQNKNTNKNLVFEAHNNLYLAPYACFSSRSRGRLHKERITPNRSEFQRDRDRILHSTAFRRLEYKTQVFLYNEGDHYRTRLTHSLEVSQIARSICRILLIDEDLCEAVAIAHDMGHSPFGHAGEYALQECMKDYGGFDHNAQTIRILTKLEKKYVAFDGLNLSWECLEGAAKHNGPIKDVPRALLEYNKIHDLELNSYASMEAQVAAISDDIAYNSHDIEDGIRAKLFTLDELMALPIISDEIKKIKSAYPDAADLILINEVRSELIKHMLNDVIDQTNKNIDRLDIKTVDDVRKAGQQIVDFSPEFNKKLLTIRKFLMEKMYRHHKVLIMTSKAKRVVHELFDFYIENPDCLPPGFLQGIDMKNKNEVAVTIADFIAGMTDRFAFRQHGKIFDTNITNL
jgi:dGTPase